MARYFKPLGASALAAALAAGVTGRLDAQARQQIFLQYDGYVRIKGGSYVLAFGYFNLNNTDVPIAAGAANAFTPSPGDRNQPVVFVKGRHRFACTIVVDQNFDGKLQWTWRSQGKPVPRPRRPSIRRAARPARAGAGRRGEKPVREPRADDRGRNFAVRSAIH